MELCFGVVLRFVCFSMDHQLADTLIMFCSELTGAEKLILQLRICKRLYVLLEMDISKCVTQG